MRLETFVEHLDITLELALGAPQDIRIIVPFKRVLSAFSALYDPLVNKLVYIFVGSVSVDIKRSGHCLRQVGSSAADFIQDVAFDGAPLFIGKLHIKRLLCFIIIYIISFIVKIYSL